MDRKVRQVMNTARGKENPPHYVARIVVERVDFLEIETRNGMAGGKSAEVKRVVTELATNVIKTNSLASLVDKVGAHLHLIEDLDSIDPVRRPGTRSSES